MKRGPGCDGCVSRARRTQLMHAAKPRGPVPPTLGSSSQAMICGRRWLQSPVHRGARHKPKTIAQGVPGCFGVPVVLPPCFLLHGAHGCFERPALPVPSLFRGTKLMHNSGKSCRENAKARQLLRSRRVGKGALAPCPPFTHGTRNGGLASPTLVELRRTPSLSPPYASGVCCSGSAQVACQAHTHLIRRNISPLAKARPTGQEIIREAQKKRQRRTS